MDYLYVKNLEKYHPGYKDRGLIWAKIYFSMISGDADFEMLEEIDKWRFVVFIILQLKTKKPVMLDPTYLERKGFNLKKRPISKTLQMLHNFTEVRNEPSSPAVIDAIDGCIYFIQCQKTNLIKIGYTKRIRERIKRLEYRTGNKIDFLYGHLGTIQKENEYHKKFLNLLVSPEWYKPDQSILDFIEKLRQATNIANVTEDYGLRVQDVTQIRVEKIRVDKNKEEYMSVFEEAHKLYPGTKRGCQTEYENFCKKHKGYTGILPLLKPAIEQQILWRENTGGTFRPDWKNFETWINKRCWEDVVDVSKPIDPTMQLIEDMTARGELK